MAKSRLPKNHKRRLINRRNLKGSGLRPYASENSLGIWHKWIYK